MWRPSVTEGRTVITLCLGKKPFSVYIRLLRGNSERLTNKKFIDFSS